MKQGANTEPEHGIQNTAVNQPDHFGLWIKIKVVCLTTKVMNGIDGAEHFLQPPQ